MVGVKVGNVDSIDSQYKCTVCHLLLRDPMQLICGHRQCKSCVHKDVQDFIRCFECDQQTLNEKMFCDRGIVNDMRKIPVNCCDCSWEGSVERYREHSMRNHLHGTTAHPLVMQLRGVNESCNELQANFHILNSTIRNCFNDVNHLKTKICFISYYGTVVLKIDDAKATLNTPGLIMVSPPIDTSPTGYKMRICFRLHGDNIGQPIHLSASVFIVHGEHDVRLKWPCNVQLVFCLFDLKNQKEHFIKSFQSDLYMRHGFFQLIPLATILQENNPYLVNDRLHLKVLIREKPIPIDILPQIMSIDPNLSFNKQEELVEEQIKKRQASPSKLILVLKLRKHD